MNLVAELYEPKVTNARQLLEDHPTIRRLLADDCPRELLALWLIHFSAHGVEMVRHVEGWITRAGLRCTELGMNKLGGALQKHARQEANHELLMVDDLHKLVARWNIGARHKLSSDELLARPPLPETEDYIQLHEEVIESRTPYRQLAIEYEIERMSTILGPRVLDQCRILLESETSSSFITEHVSLDIGHAAFNERQLQTELNDRPQQADQLAAAGSRALECYVSFMAACLELAEKDLAREFEEINLAKSST
jgi:pyrroloquinoline quinone (PQQ) biosynthesis protein C